MPDPQSTGNSNPIRVTVAAVVIALTGLVAYALGGWRLALPMILVIAAVVLALAWFVRPRWWGPTRVQVYTLTVFSFVTLTLFASDPLWLPLLSKLYERLGLDAPPGFPFWQRAIVELVFLTGLLILNAIWRPRAAIVQGVSPEEFARIMKQAGADEKQLRDENDQLRRQLAEALTNAATKADRGNDQAQQAIDQARENGDLTQLKAVLIDAANELANSESMTTFIDHARQIGSISFLRREWDDAEAWLTKVVGLAHDDHVANILLGDLERRTGSLAESLSFYERAHKTVQHHLDRGPDSQQWQRELSVSWNKIGDVRKAQGNLPGALSAYESSLKIRERLATQDPTHTEWQRDLSLSQERIGDVRVAQGDLAGALSAYESDLEIAERLAAQDPSHTEWQRDLSASWNKIGDVRKAQGDLAGALSAYESSLETRERLAAQDPRNAGWQKDLAISHFKLATTRESSDRSAALAQFRSAAEILERLATQTDDPQLPKMLETVRSQIQTLEAGNGNE